MKAVLCTHSWTRSKARAVGPFSTQSGTPMATTLGPLILMDTCFYLAPAVETSLKRYDPRPCLFYYMNRWYVLRRLVDNLDLYSYINKFACEGAKRVILPHGLPPPGSWLEPIRTGWANATGATRHGPPLFGQRRRCPVSPRVPAARSGKRNIYSSTTHTKCSHQRWRYVPNGLFGSLFKTFLLLL